jgi:protein-S-isoprenylcysteine O-methyltransferase Ste14
MNSDPITRDALILAAIWLIYFALHSVFASLRLKRIVSNRWPNLMPGYRIAFNLFAILALLIPLWWMVSAASVPVWKWTGFWWWITNLIAFTAIAGFVISLRYYDGQEFMGLRQLRENERHVEDQENFHLSPFHRYVRHPWYFFGIVIICTRDMDSLMLVTAIAVTLYFIIGSRLEEQKLLCYYGDVYREYMNKVPGIFPLPWRYLSAKEAELLLQRYKSAKLAQENSLEQKSPP